MNYQEFAYTRTQAFPHLQSGLPFIPIVLKHQKNLITTTGLVDSGSTLNVLPFDIGIQLGLTWETQTYALPSLIGNLQGLPAFGVLLEGEVQPFAPVPLAFAWTRSNDIPIILGQINFFAQFDVYFLAHEVCFNLHQDPLNSPSIGYMMEMKNYYTNISKVSALSFTISDRIVKTIG